MWARLGFDLSRPSRLVAISRLTPLRNSNLIRHIAMPAVGAVHRIYGRHSALTSARIDSSGIRR